MNESSFRLSDEITPADLEQVRKLVVGWVENRRSAAWMETNLADDFRFTTFLLPRVVEKAEFIQIVSNTPAELSVVSVAAEAVGKIVVSRLLLHVIEETFTADMGAGMPSGAEIQGSLVGRQLVYTSGFRRHRNGWRCFNHHQMGHAD
jgi:hypothetical protein